MSLVDKLKDVGTEIGGWNIISMISGAAGGALSYSLAGGDPIQGVKDGLIVGSLWGTLVGGYSGRKVVNYKEKHGLYE